jgi:hypothetical protein
MSYFVANSLTINKEFTKFKVKGGSNNLVPRYNEWTGWIDIEHLLDEVCSGNIQFGESFDNKLLTIQTLAFEYKAKWGGNWDENTDMYHSFRKDPIPVELQNLNKEFLRDLKEKLKGHTKKEYIVKIGGSYVYKRYRHQVLTTWQESSAQKFGEFQAKNLIRGYNNRECEIIKI